MIITGIKLPKGFTMERRVAGKAYPRNGNLGHGTVYYRYVLYLDGRQVDQSAKRGVLIRAANEYGRAGYKG